MQKWKIATDRAQRLDEKNGSIYLVIMFAPVDATKKSVTVWRKRLSASEDLI